MSISRVAVALEFLLDLVRQGRPHDAQEALRALELQKSNEEIVSRVAQAVAEQSDSKLAAIFHQRFR
jgi:hypothetical protein